MSEIFDKTIGALNTALNARLTRQNVIGSNIANADTPGYRAKRVEFEQALRQALQITDQIAPEADHPDHISPRGMEPINPAVFEDPNGIESLDGNTVNRSDEMARLSENQILYNASIEALKKKLSMLRHVVADGGGGR